MSVIVIGDRAVGKTTMVHYLADDRNQERVFVEDGPDSSMKDNIDPTQVIKSDTPIKMVVDLPISKQIQVLWTDTPGELFTNKQMRLEQSAAWAGVLDKMGRSRYLILLLPPHRGIIKSHLLEGDPENRSLDDFPTTEVWQRRVGEWLNLLGQKCPKIKHLLICLHAVDLVCENLQAEGEQWRYEENGFNWHNYSKTIHNTYFGSLNGVISQYKKQNQGQLVKFFMTSIKQRSLLELPWLYIGSYEKT